MNTTVKTIMAGACMWSALAAGGQNGASPAVSAAPPRMVRPGIDAPGVKRDMSTIVPASVFDVGGAPDWQVATDDALWVSNSPLGMLHRLNPATNEVQVSIDVGKKPCSGLAAGFGSIWVPVCGDKQLVRVDMATNKIVGVVPVAPADSEGGVAAGPDAVWIVVAPGDKLARIDPKTNAVANLIGVPAGSASCLYADGAIWITSPEKNLLTRVDPAKREVTDTIEVGPKPRFQTFGAGSVWTLNQGDGTVSRIDVKSRKVVATIRAGIPGDGGEIAFGAGHVWATVFQIPISEIDPATNTVTRQWVGPGGDSIRVAHGSVWLSNLQQHNIWRIDLSRL
jgi:virginiamycin B lyase